MRSLRNRRNPAQERLDRQALVMRRSYLWETERKDRRARVVRVENFELNVFAAWMLSMVLAEAAPQVSVVAPSGVPGSSPVFLAQWLLDGEGVSPRTSYWRNVGVLPFGCTLERATQGFDITFWDKAEGEADYTISLEGGELRVRGQGRDVRRAVQPEIFQVPPYDHEVIGAVETGVKALNRGGVGAFLKDALCLASMSDCRKLPDRVEDSELPGAQKTRLEPDVFEKEILRSCFWEGEEDPSFFLQTLREILPLSEQRETCVALIKDDGNFRDMGRILEMAELL